MDRLVAFDRQVLILGEGVAISEQVRQDVPEYKALHVLNLGPSHVYVKTLKVSSKDGDRRAELELECVLSPGEKMMFFEHATFGCLADKGLRHNIHGPYMEARFVIEVAIESVSPHGEHAPRLTLEQDSRRQPEMTTFWIHDGPSPGEST